jgi:hypothetical protein
MPSKTGWESFRDRTSIYDLMTFVPRKSGRAFENILKKLYEEFSPVDISEEELVQRLAVLYFERDQLRLYFQFKIEIRQAELNREVPRAQSIAGLKSRAIQLRDAKILKEVQEYISEVEDGAIQKPSPRDHLVTRTTPANDTIEYLTSLEVPPSNGRDIFIKINEEFPIDARIEKLEKIDVIIDRTIKRLMQLKAMKQMHRELEPKVISIAQDKRGAVNS